MGLLNNRESAMARRMPSLAALLGLVAIAGYQHRDKIAEFVRSLSNSDSAGGSGGVIDSVKKVVTDWAGGTDIKGGLGELVDQFNKAGEGKTVDSWVGTGPNAPITETQMEKTLGAELIDKLVQQTGLGREELLSRLSKVLPEAVDKLTPEGRLPA
jgi:uncharacterized protein YidB (DUF937 family)